MNTVQRAADKFLNKIGRTITRKPQEEQTSAGEEACTDRNVPYHTLLESVATTAFCEIPESQKNLLVVWQCNSVALQNTKAIDFFFQDFNETIKPQWKVSMQDVTFAEEYTSSTPASINTMTTAFSLNAFKEKVKETQIVPIEIPLDVVLEQEPLSLPCEDSSASVALDMKITENNQISAVSIPQKRDFHHSDLLLLSLPHYSPPVTPDYVNINLSCELDFDSMSTMSMTSSSSDSSYVSPTDSPISSADSSTSVLPAEETKSGEFLKMLLQSNKFKKLVKEQVIREPLKVEEMKPVILNGDVTPRMLSIYERGWSQKGRTSIIPDSKQTLHLYNQRMRNTVDNLQTFPHWTCQYLKSPMRDWHYRVSRPIILHNKTQIEYSRKSIILTKSETLWLLDIPSILCPETSTECDLIKGKNARVELARRNRSIGLFPKHKCWQTAAIQSITYLKEKQIQTETVHFKDKYIMTSPFLIDEAYNEQYEKPDHSYRAFILYYQKKFENASKFFNYLQLYTSRHYSFLTMCNRMERYLKYNKYWDIIARFEGMSKDSHLKSDSGVFQENDENLPMWAQRKRVIANEPVPHIEHIFSVVPETVQNNYSVSSMVFSSLSPDILVVGYKSYEPITEHTPSSESDSFEESDSESEVECRTAEHNLRHDSTEDGDRLESLFNLEDFEKSKPPQLPPPGLIYCWTIKNCDRPERIFLANGGISSLSFSKAQPYLLAAGTTEGTVCFYDVREFQPNALSTSGFTLCKGSSVQVGWSTLNLSTRAPREVILAVSENGFFLRFFPEKTFPSTLIRRVRNVVFMDRDYKTNELVPKANYTLCTSLAVNDKDDNLVIIGSREGLIYQISDRYEIYGYDQLYTCHGNVKEVSWSPFCSDMFLSCGDDAYLRIWLKNEKTPHAEIMTQTEEPIISADWSRLSPKVIVLITHRRIELWNIHWVYTPIAFYLVNLEAKLTCVRFNPRSWSIAVGDDLGNVHLYEVKDMYLNF